MPFASCRWTRIVQVSLANAVPVASMSCRTSAAILERGATITRWGSPDAYHIVTQSAANNPRFPSLSRRGKLAVELSVANICLTLNKRFSFALLYDYDDHEGQPHIPKHEWILEACNLLVQFGDAEWIKDMTDIRIFFRRYDDTLNHFVEKFVNKCVSLADESQQSLFDSTEISRISEDSES